MHGKKARNPWERIHIDYAGPFLGKMFLILVDSYSKWMEAFPVKDATSAATIDCFDICFATHGLPQICVFDNGSCFTSEEFERYLERNGIRHKTSAPYHPATNGLAERAVRTFKNTMKKLNNQVSIQTAVNRFLFAYRITPHSATGKAPCELLMNRRLNSRHHILRPEVPITLEDPYPHRVFEINDPIWLRNYGKGDKWVKGVITCRTGPISYRIQTGYGIVRKHVNQLRSRVTEFEPVNYPESSKPPNTSSIQPTQQIPQQPLTAPITPTPAPLPSSEIVSIANPTTPLTETSIQQTPGPTVTPSLNTNFRPVRNRKPPRYLEDYETMMG